MREELDNLVGNSGGVTIARYGSGLRPACGDHERGVDVRVHGHSAGCANECLSVAKAFLLALMAGLGSIGGIDLLDGDPFQGGLVGHEVLELAVGPKRDHAVQMLVRDLGSLPYPLEILHPDHSATVSNGLFHDRLREIMVYPGGMAPLPSRKPSQGAPSAPRAFGLEAGADAPPVFTVGSQFRSALLSASACRREVPDPKIDPKDISLNGIRNFSLDHNVAIEAISGPDEYGICRNLSFKRQALIGSDVEFGASPADMRAKADVARLEDQPKRPRVEGDQRGAIDELSVHLRRLERSGRPTKSGTDQICRETELGPDSLIKCVMQSDGVGFFVVLTPLGNLRASFCVAEEKLVESRKIGGIYRQFATDRPRCLHEGKLSSVNSLVKNEGALAPPPKGGGLRAYVL